MNSFHAFNSKILSVLEHSRQKNIIIYGDKGSYLQWLLKENGFNVAYIIDRWETSEYAHINHLMTLYYLDEDEVDDYVIINSVPRIIGVKNSFIDIGEQWDKAVAKDIEIIDLWDIIYSNYSENVVDNAYPSISYFDYLQTSYGLDTTNEVRRKDVKGKGAHGYYPTDVRLLKELFLDTFSNNRKVFDFGCGKGAVLCFLYENGYEKLGGIECTPDIYNIGKSNINKLYTAECGSGRIKEIEFLLGNAMELNEILDDYDLFFFFNPFAYWVFENVFDNIISSIRRKKRKINLVYAEPMCHKLIISSGLFRKVGRYGHTLSGITYDTYVYESI